MYQQKYLINSFNDSNQNRFVGRNNHLFSQMISGSFAVIVEIPSSLPPFLDKKKEIPKGDIHSFSRS
jgi:hypothetical protein